MTDQNVTASILSTDFLLGVSLMNRGKVRLFGFLLRDGCGERMCHGLMYLVSKLAINGWDLGAAEALPISSFDFCGKPILPPMESAAGSGHFNARVWYSPHKFT